MKSQLDWIVTVASLVMALIAAGIFFMQKPTPRQIAEPEKVIIAAPTYPAGAVTFSNSLPNAGGSGGGGGAPGFGSGAPGAPGPGGFGSPGPPPGAGGGPGVNTNRPGGPPSGQFGPGGPGTKPGAGRAGA